MQNIRKYCIIRISNYRNSITQHNFKEYHKNYPQLKIKFE